jgi:hypothetical protein
MRKIYSFIFFALSVLTLHAQTIQKLTSSSVSGTVCPVTYTYYEVNASGYWNTCTISWSATNGTVINDPYNRKKAAVIWKDIPGAKGKVTVTFTNCDGDGGSVSREELILSIKEQSWGSYGNSINIDYCSKSPVYITMPRMIVQGTGGVAQPPLTEAAYVWTLPAGWRQLGTNNTGTFGTPTNYITIEPIDCAKPGSVKVYGTLVGAEPFCNSAANSATATISLSGANPVVTVDPPPGFSGVTACNTTPVTFTASLSHTLGCVNNYNWTFPSSWTEISRNANTITLRPSGTPSNSGNIRATVNFTCGTSIQSANYVPPYIPPVVIGPNLVCGSESYTAQNTSGLTLTWSSSNTNVATVNASGMVTRVGNASGEITITTTLPCAVPPATKTIWVGPRKPTGFVSVVVDPWLGRIKARVEPVPDATGYQWYKDGVLYTGPGQNSDYVTMPIPKNNCSIMDYSIGVRAINACGTSAAHSEIHPNPCYEGGYYYSYFPNPASEKLIIEINNQFVTEKNEEGLYPGSALQNNHHYRLYDFATNTIVLEGILSGKTEVDVSTLNRGKYVLKIQIDKSNEEVHHIIIN